MPANSVTVGRLGSTRRIINRPIEPQQRLFSLDQVSRVTGIGLSQLHIEIKSPPGGGEPRLRSLKYGKRRLVRAEDLDRFIDALQNTVA
jgi:hypothetical protein